MDVQDKIIATLADRECKRLSRRVIRHLQSMKDSMLSGDDSALANFWDEFCVQVQGQESGFWEHYVDLVNQIVLGFVEKLDSETKKAIWLQTDEAADSTYEEDGADIPWS